MMEAHSAPPCGPNIQSCALARVVQRLERCSSLYFLTVTKKLDLFEHVFG
jgi:hypothetical protein